MKVAIMQPYFLPYIGYFQLINAVDTFVIYDNIEFTKKGWINRNRILLNGKDDLITIPIRKDSDYLNVNQRYLAESYEKEKIKIIRKISELYKKSPQYDVIFPLIKNIFSSNENNLFDFIFNSLKIILQYLDIKTEIVFSSTISIDHSLKSKDKVITICEKLGTTHYINPIGGVDLYFKEDFKQKGIDLHFLKSNHMEYQQFDADFMPWLSIIDVLMFNSPKEIKRMLNQFEII
jgi:mRNA-degrading endonuclease HigB of HigAB toxin-antitoxin module